ncbi:MAG: hypothetical protein ABJB03_04955 [Rhodoglobus sp.]
MSARRGAAILVAVLVSGVLAATPVAAAPEGGQAPVAHSLRAAPGVPELPKPIYQEDFQNAPATGATKIASYAAANGSSYTADPVYLNAAYCNGVVFGRGATNAALTAAGFCTASWWPSARSIAAGMGLYHGDTVLNQNLAVAEQTVGGGPSYLGVMLQGTNIPTGAIGGGGRFVTFSADIGNLCSSGVQSRDRFYLLDGPSAIALNTADYNICADPSRQTFVVDGRTVTVGTFTGDRAALVTSPTIGFRMTNQQASGSGNDQAFDNFRILDATPQVDKSFTAMDPVSGESRVTFTVTNTAELGTKAGWSATDSLPAGLAVSATPDSATTCTNGVLNATSGSGTISFSGDLAGTVAQRTSCTFQVDVAPATATAQGGAAQTFQNCPSNFSAYVGLNLPSECAVVSFPAVAKLGVAKATSATSAVVEGDVVTYSITATNTGGAAYTAATPAVVTDDLSGVLDDATFNGDATSSLPGTIAYSAPALTWSGALAAGASVTISYTMSATLAGNGSLVNSACIPVAQADGDACDTVTTTVAIAPAIDLVKSVSPSAPASFVAGQPVVYTFVATNTGNLVLNAPSVSETSFDGAGVAPVITCPPTPTLAPGAQLVCSASYTLVQADVDNHSLADPLVNEAVAGASASNGAIVASPVRSAQLPALQTPAISLAKSVSAAIFTTAGQTVTYEFLVTNTGNVTLTGAVIDETTFTGSGPLGGVTCPAGAASLAPGAQVTCTATYVLTQQDVDAGSVDNGAVATAQPPTGARISSAPDEALVTIAAAPALSLAKSAGPGGFTHAGEQVLYTFDVVNTGNVSLTDLTIDESAFSGTDVLGSPTCDVTVLAPTEAATCTVSYPLTQADVDAGIVTNSASAIGTPPAGAAVSSAVSSALVAISPSATITLAKTIDHTVVAGEGAAVAYSFLVTNTGQATVGSVSVGEVAFSGSGSLSAVTCPATPIAPAASITCTATYAVTAADVAARSVTNTAEVTATGPTGVVLTSNQSTAVLTVDPIAAALAQTGAAFTWILASWALGLLAAGAVLAVVRLRHSRRGVLGTH